MNNEGILGFVDLLRRAGLSLPVGSVLSFVEAVSLVGHDLKSIYWSGRATLVHSPVENVLYDELFRQWILGTTVELSSERLPTEEVVVADDDDFEGEQPDQVSSDGEAEPVVRFSRTETLRTLDFAEMTGAERSEADRLIAALKVRPVTRRSRRLHRSRASKGALDFRRTLRESLRTGGEPLRRRTQMRRDVPRRVVLLVDISGSMASYSRSLLRFAHASVAGRTSVEAFVLGTRLTRLTRQLATKDPDDALRRASNSVEDWSSGTRLGEGVREFNDRWGSKGMARGALVVILSDGWDRGDPAVLGSEMARLSRVAHRIIWVNPLKASDGYAPLARGMAAALPFVDEFIEGHSLDSLDHLAEILSSVGRPVRSSRPLSSLQGTGVAQ